MLKLYHGSNPSEIIVINGDSYTCQENEHLREDKSGLAGYSYIDCNNMCGVYMCGIYTDKDKKSYFIIGKNDVVIKRYDITNRKVFIDNERVAEDKRRFQMYIDGQLVEDIIYESRFDYMQAFFDEKEEDSDVLLSITGIINRQRIFEGY